MSTNDFSPEEDDFRRAIAPALATLRADAGPCPHPDLLMAVLAGVLPEKAAAIEQHLGQCAVCRQLSQDLAAYEHPGVTADEDRRIRARWTPRPAWRTWALAASIGLLIGLGVIARMERKPAPTASVSAPSQPAAQLPAPSTAPARTLLALEKAAIRIPAAAVLVYRGDSANDAMLKALAAALKPYSAGDYQEAARRLETLSRQYPDSAEAAFYLGVSRLFLGDNRQAVDSFMAARQHQDQALADSITWYLAVALNRAGQDPDAAREAASLCARAGEYKEKACAAVEALKAR